MRSIGTNTARELMGLGETVMGAGPPGYFSRLSKNKSMIVGCGRYTVMSRTPHEWCRAMSGLRFWVKDRAHD